MIGLKVFLAFGTRACTIKMAPLIREGKKRGHEIKSIYSGQHYSPNLYEELFDDLEIPRPDYDLKAKGTSLEIGSAVLAETAKILQAEKPDIMLTHGDTYTAMFFSIAGALSLVPVGHVEAGLRTYSWEPFPEQICTKTSDACSSLFFAATEKNRADLLAERVPHERIFVVGNTVVDACLQHSKIAEQKSRILEQLGIQPKAQRKRPLVFWSVHRKENMLHPERMKGIFDSLLEMEDIDFVCSVLPSTQLSAEKNGYAERLKSATHIKWMPCLPKYTDALRVLMDSDLCLTDSGGLQEECSSLHIPCLTLRFVTDRPESVKSGGNKCIGFRTSNIIKEVNKAVFDKHTRDRMTRATNPYGDGNTSGRIFDLLEQFKGKFERWEKSIVKKQ